MVGRASDESFGQAACKCREQNRAKNVGSCLCSEPGSHSPYTVTVWDITGDGKTGLLGPEELSATSKLGRQPDLEHVQLYQVPRINPKCPTPSPTRAQDGVSCQLGAHAGHHHSHTHHTPIHHSHTHHSHVPPLLKSLFLGRVSGMLTPILLCAQK